MKKPLVSIILTYYKKRSFITKTIKSIFNQSYQNFELICVYDDDNKKDLKFLKKLIKNLKRKNIIINKRNLGVATSRNIGIKHAKGKFIAFIDADDIWKKDKLKNQIKKMSESNSDISYTSYKIIDIKGRLEGYRKIPKEVSYKSLSEKCYIGLSSVVVKAKILKKHKFPKLKTQEDFGLWLKLIRKGYLFQPINKVYMSWRKNKNSLSYDTKQKIFDAFRLFYRYENKNLISSIYSVLILSIKKILN